MPRKQSLVLSICLLCYPLFLTAQVYPISHRSAIDEGNGVVLSICRIAAERSVQAARVILLIHGGGPGSMASFDFSWNDSPSFATELAKKGFIVYLLDIRGWEYSTAPGYDLHDTTVTAGSCVEAAADIDAAIDRIRKEERIEKVNLFGWATGGHWASYYTTLHNEKVDRLIVVNTLYGVNAPWSLSADFADPGDSTRYNVHLPVYRESTRRALINARLNAVPTADKTAWIDTASLNDYAVAVTEYTKNILRVPGGYRKESFYMAHGRRYWNAADITVPVLILRSQYDFWSRPVDATTYYTDLVHSAGKKMVQLPEATHFVFLDKPAKGRNRLLQEIDDFIPTVHRSMQIAQLQTDTQVLDFVRGFDGIYRNSFLVPPKPVANGAYEKERRSFGALSYEKGDFDGNGTTDLLFNGYRYDYEGNAECQRTSLVILSFANDSFRVIDLTLDPYGEFLAAKKLAIDGKDCLCTRQRKTSYYHNDTIFRPVTIEQTDTLTFAWDTFLEKRKPGPKHPIDAITYCRWGGLVSSPPFRMIIRGDSIRLMIPVILEPGEGAEPTIDSGGIFLAKLDAASFRKLQGILQYIDFPSLPDNYAVNWTDGLTGDLKITYDGGHIKKISDYGLVGSYGLAALHDLFDQIRDTQHWTRISTLSLADFGFCADPS